MPVARLPRIALCLALLCVAAPAASALYLGETRAQLLAQHGAPGAEDHGRNVAMYFWEGWSAEVEFQGDKIGKLTYRRSGYLRDAEIQSLFEANGGSAHWRETTAINAQNREWARDDGAYASCPRMHAQSIFFESGLVFADSPGAAKSPATSTPSTVATKAPTYPKPLGAFQEPDLPVADSPVKKPSSNDSPGAPAKLPAQEIAPSTPTSPAGEAAAPASEQSSEAPQPAAAAPPSHDAGQSHLAGYALGIFGLLALGGGIAYLVMRRARAADMPFSASVPPPVTRRQNPSAAPDLDTLRIDQFELMIAEIFRRQGCHVELSSALGLDDGIDLMLRRDSESILVQCKHWKTAQVGAPEIDEFAGAMINCGAPRGLFVTTGEFSPEARVSAAGNGIDLMDGAALSEIIAAAARRGENLCAIPTWIENFVAHARVFDPECPVCHGAMVIRHSRAHGASTWMCRGYPRCPGRREPRLDLLPAAASR